MKRKLLFILFCFFLGQSVYAQGKLFVCIYVRPDYTMDLDVLKSKLRKTINECEEGSYVVILGDVTPTIMTSDNYDERALIGAIYQHTGLALSPLQEIEMLSSVLENNLQLRLTKDAEGYPVISSNGGYTSIDFRCFVGGEFIKSDYVNAVIARMMVVNNIGNVSGMNADVSFYPCGANYSVSDVQFKELYGIKTKPVIEKR